MSIINELKWRGLINNITNQAKIDLFEKDKGIIYIGFDPSFDSLHLGNYNMLLVLKRFKQQGHKAFALVGGATGLIGDPSGKKAERQILPKDTIDQNIAKIKKQIENISGATIFNNADIYKNMNIFDFLRDIGKLINVNYLLEKDTIKTRLESGISYAEFSYGLIQGYDFAWLYNHEKVQMQIGGSDQWGNITTGIEMIRKLYGDDNKAVGLTINLLTKADGTKFGKSESGAIYLDPRYTTPHQMYQFLFNQPDSDVEKLLKYLTFYTEAEIQKIMSEHNAAPAKHIAQRELAIAIVKDIHGEDELKKCMSTSTSLFNGDIDSLDHKALFEALQGTPTFHAKKDTYNIVDLLVECKVVTSKSQARQLVESKAIYINNKLIDKIDILVNKKAALNNHFSYMKKGKKNYYLIIWE